MSHFYTNVQLAGNTILYRGYENGQPVQSRTHFCPTLYVLSKNQEKYKTLTGKYVSPVKFESSREAREFIQQYEGVEGFEVHGYERFVYQFIKQEYEKTRFEEEKETTTVVILDPARPPDVRSKPARAMMVAIAGALSLILSSLLAFIFEAINNLTPENRAKLDAIKTDLHTKKEA